MRRIIILTIGGGALAASFAYSYGILAAVLAYVLGGMLGAGLGLLVSMLEQPESEDAPASPVQRAQHISPRPVAERNRAVS